MPRLIVECRSIDVRSAAAGWEARLLLAVARAQDGAPVLGLEQADFQVRGPSGSRLSLVLDGDQPGAVAARASGIYSLRVRDELPAAEPPEIQGSYPIGIQVRRREAKTGAWIVGQTVVRLPELPNAKLLPMRARTLSRAAPPAAGTGLATPPTGMPLRLRP